MTKILITLAMMVCGNIFMTAAWYWHLKNKGEVGKPLIVIILISWLIAFLEYCIMVPANRLGHFAGLSVAQLKIIQEVITLLVFVPFSVYFLGDKWRLDYLWAFLCILGAVYFVNRHLL
ncbi:MAG: DMT family protein [Kiritimatiellae bacterium]|jgi:uncharacterized protein (DUF486 family)|nr:DMT family protein [Kiritimatiellia bacterium]MBO7299099.1 DMT family protein [Kiritimatiellia bacterium]MBQ2281206.1 DMT family protein [Kiritimatiellia bacterium]